MKFYYTIFTKSENAVEVEYPGALLSEILLRKLITTPQMFWQDGWQMRKSSLSGSRPDMKIWTNRQVKLFRFR
jgi:hypothetical protein